MKFISDISLFWLFPIGATAFLLTYFFYRKEAWLNDIPNWTKKSLFTLRFLSLFFIGVLLLGILFESFTYRKEKPIFITLIDNSHSLKNFKDSSKVAQRIADFNSKIKEKFSEKFELVSYAVGDKFRQTESFNFI
jgi:multisubunit Na+/H+ antiporter MnhB subunit